MPTSGSSSLEDLDTREIGASTSSEAATSAAQLVATLDVSPRLGRYLPIEELGRGGMGRVLRAYDPKLQREVALKVLHMDDPLARARMVREARTMARLSHAHVVAVYDVEDDPRLGVVLVMELVKGSTLQAWLRQRERSWTEIVEAFIEAGRGLAAAHDEGLLHRDFKPANVLVSLGGPDDAASRGPFKVTDFGLAKPRPEPPSGRKPPVGRSTPTFPPPTHEDALDALTEDGTVMGTPLYMAPEQHVGALLTSAADQYAFCVALWQALVGQPPFMPPDLVAAKRRGPRAWPRTCPAPRTIGDAIRRGLAAQPLDRWPSMTALLDALSPVLERRRRRRPVVLASMLGGVGLAAVAWQALLWSEEQRARARIEACETTTEPMDALWNDEARATVREALLATGVRYAAATADGAIPWLDRYAESWKHARVEACTNAEVHRTWDAELLDRALWCLEERRMDLGSLVAELSRADATTVQMAVDATIELPMVSPCMDESAIESLPPPPPEAARVVIDGVRSDLSRAATLEVAGKYDEGLALAREVRARAQGLDWPPLQIRAMAIEGRLLESTGAYAEAERVQVAAFAEAIETGAWDVAQSVGRELAFNVGVRQARTGEGRLWTQLADASEAHLGASAQRDAQRLLSIAALCHIEGAYADAKEHYQRALEALQQALGPDHPKVAHVLDQLATTESRLGNPRAAIVLGEQALRSLEATLGRDHPRSTSVLVNLAVSYQLTGDLPKARALYERALSTDEQVLGVEHPKVALDLHGYAGVLKAMGEHDEAVVLYERALAINEARFGPEHPRSAAILNNLANVHLQLHDRERARTLYERALSIGERTLGPDHPDLATSLANVASVEDDETKARAMLERALAIREKALGPRHPDLEVLLRALAKIATDQGRHLDAIELEARLTATEANSVIHPAKRSH